MLLWKQRMRKVLAQIKIMISNHLLSLPNNATKEMWLKQMIKIFKKLNNKDDQDKYILCILEDSLIKITNKRRIRKCQYKV